MTTSDFINNMLILLGLLSILISAYSTIDLKLGHAIIWAVIGVLLASASGHF